MRAAPIAASVLLAGLPAMAQDWDCADPGALPQNGMNFCAWRAYQEADRELNVVYKQIREQVRAMDYGARADGKTEAEALRDTQRAWITFRDLACDMEGLPARGGSMERLLVAACLEDMTKRRVRDLRSLTGAEGG